MGIVRLMVTRGIYLWKFLVFEIVGFFVIFFVFLKLDEREMSFWMLFDTHTPQKSHHVMEIRKFYNETLHRMCTIQTKNNSNIYI
mmetsp:Transcript_36350/g.54265  ORF Transcript_36350/g.54265 Transcript_36350/m.54265 type:complete len:85 (+) Transcript_36350:984-1238(+)